MRPRVSVAPKVAEPDVVAAPRELEGDAGAHHEVGRAALEAVLQERHGARLADIAEGRVGDSKDKRHSEANSPGNTEMSSIFIQGDSSVY